MITSLPSSLVSSSMTKAAAASAERRPVSTPWIPLKMIELYWPIFGWLGMKLANFSIGVAATRAQPFSITSGIACWP